jgi:4-methyl-5(b-hydroxyethyl)-thiazole monophosphate biosynthesis
MKVLVPLAQGCEELEAVTIMDLLVRAGIEVVSASLDNDLNIMASRGTHLVAKTTLSEVATVNFDLIVLPGGLPGATFLEQSRLLRTMMQQTAARGKKVAAVCAAPKALVAAGLLDGKTATSFPGVIDVTPAPKMRYSDASVVVDGNIITSRGPGTAMDFTLTLIEELVGQDMRCKVEAELVR